MNLCHIGMSLHMNLAINIMQQLHTAFFIRHDRIHQWTDIALMGLFFSEKAPSNYREWLHSNYEFYDTLAPFLHEEGVLVEPDSREPWFLCESHTDNCLDDTLERFERAVDITMEKLSDAA